MKRITYLLCALVVLVSCSVQLAPNNGENGKDDVSKQFNSPFDFPNSANNTFEILSYLSSDELEGRDSGSEGLEKAAHYIQDVFQRHGVQPYFESYFDTLQNFEKTTYNVVGLVPGNDAELSKEYIIIGAHYDHIGRISPENGDAIANGANDNASGTTAVVQLAKYFGKNKTNKRSLLFVLFSAEEKGLKGAYHIAEKLKGENLPLYMMLNFEMIGVPMEGKDYLVYATGYNKSNIAAVVNSHANKKLVGFLPKAKEYHLFQRSDNYPFDKVFQVPSHTFCSFDFTNFPQYHKVGDEMATMNIAHINSLIDAFIPVVEKLASAATPEVRYNN
ncbi:MAG: M28 family peptidase [Flavobacteriaceae bacterium]|nr:M28 family peptidase [Flavobacteriaceae bacterium]